MLSRLITTVRAEQILAGLRSRWIAAACLVRPWLRTYGLDVGDNGRIRTKSVEVNENDGESGGVDDDDEQDVEEGRRVGSLSNSNQHEVHCCLPRATRAITARRVVRLLLLVGSGHVLIVDTLDFNLIIFTILCIYIRAAAPRVLQLLRRKRTMDHSDARNSTRRSARDRVTCAYDV